jgi:hypothetical protein
VIEALSKVAQCYCGDVPPEAHAARITLPVTPTRRWIEDRVNVAGFSTGHSVV